MIVTIITYTNEPMQSISFSAGVCYRKRDESINRVETCYKRGHMSVFEHASVTFFIEGVSRACMAQITRHRLCSFCVESQRYCRYDLSGKDWYVVPPSFSNNVPYFDKCMREAASHYSVNVNGGMKPEDARYLLPEATKTNLVMTCNIRELFHFFDMRQDNAAQWEIRELAYEMMDATREHEDLEPFVRLYKDGEL